MEESSGLNASILELKSQIDRLKEKQAVVHQATVEPTVARRNNEKNIELLETMFDRHKAFADEQAKRFVFTILSYHEKNSKLEAAVSCHSNAS